MRRKRVNITRCRVELRQVGDLFLRLKMQHPMLQRSQVRHQGPSLSPVRVKSTGG